MGLDRVLDRELVEPELARDLGELVMGRFEHPEPDELALLAGFGGGRVEAELVPAPEPVFVGGAVDDHRPSIPAGSVRTIRPPVLDRAAIHEKVLTVRIRIPSALVLVLAATLTFAGTSQAAITVANTNDSGAGSLREALAAAPPGETIVVPAGTYTLTSEALKVTKSVTISGAGAASTIVRAGGAFGVFTITGPLDATISGLTVRDGKIVKPGGIAEGAGIFSVDANLTLRGVALTSNTVNADGVINGGIAKGAAIYLERGALNMSDCAVSANRATSIGGAAGGGGIAEGGGIYVETAPLNLTRTTATGNGVSALGGAGGGGGGIAKGGGVYLEQGSLTFNGGTAAGNSAGSNGGGSSRRWRHRRGRRDLRRGSELRPQRRRGDRQQRFRERRQRRQRRHRQGRRAARRKRLAGDRQVDDQPQRRPVAGRRREFRRASRKPGGSASNRPRRWPRPSHRARSAKTRSMPRRGPEGSAGIAVGGGIEIEGEEAPMTIANTTIAANLVRNGPGGIARGGGLVGEAAAKGSLALLSTTISGNRIEAPPGVGKGGNLFAKGLLSARSSIIADGSGPAGARTATRRSRSPSASTSRAPTSAGSTPPATRSTRTRCSARSR